MSVLRTFIFGAAVLCVCGACLPTFQSPRVTPGFRVDADAMVLSGGRIDSYSAGFDYMISINPAYGFGRRFELGAPIGAYWYGGVGAVPILMPYAKLALGDPESNTPIAVIGQFPGSVAALVGHDLGSWEPQAMASFISPAGKQHGDFTIHSRCAQDNQSLVVASIGAAFKTPDRPAFEVGVLRNSYTLSGRHVNYDAFIRMKIGF